MLSSEFQEFHDSWIRKSEEYGSTELRDLFDKFFTLYVMYNRVYAEATSEMARRGKIDLANRTTFPDRKASTDYVVQFVGGSTMLRAFDGDSEASQAIKRVCSMIDEKQFHIVLDAATGAALEGEDERLLAGLRSSNASERAMAITQLVYAVRCNTFHGHKGFENVQEAIMVPILVILRKLIDLVYARLQNPRGSLSDREGQRGRRVG